MLSEHWEEKYQVTIQVVETSVNVNNNSSFQNYTNPDDHTQQTIIIIFANTREAIK